MSLHAQSTSIIKKVSIFKLYLTRTLVNFPYWVMILSKHTSTSNAIHLTLMACTWIGRILGLVYLQIQV